MKTIYKGGKKEIYGNYRPLTMLSIPSKVSEAVICESLDKHLGKVSRSNSGGGGGGGIGKVYQQNHPSYI